MLSRITGRSTSDGNKAMASMTDLSGSVVLVTSLFFPVGCVPAGDDFGVTGAENKENHFFFETQYSLPCFVDDNRFFNAVKNLMTL